MRLSADWSSARAQRQNTSPDHVARTAAKVRLDGLDTCIGTVILSNHFSLGIYNIILIHIGPESNFHSDLWFIFADMLHVHYGMDVLLTQEEIPLAYSPRGARPGVTSSEDSSTSWHCWHWVRCYWLETTDACSLRTGNMNAWSLHQHKLQPGLSNMFFL